MKERYIAGLRSLEIARVGLAYWHPAAAEGGQDLLDVVLSLVNEGAVKTKRIELEVGDRNDPRWTEVLVKTLEFSIYEETHRFGRQGLSDTTGAMIEVDTLGCRVGGHQRYDGFHANMSDPVWGRVQPPFDWLCGCSTVFLFPGDAPRQPGRPLRTNSAVSQWSERWRVNAISKALVYL